MAAGTQMDVPALRLPSRLVVGAVAAFVVLVGLARWLVSAVLATGVPQPPGDPLPVLRALLPLSPSGLSRYDAIFASPLITFAAWTITALASAALVRLLARWVNPPIAVALSLVPLASLISTRLTEHVGNALILLAMTAWVSALPWEGRVTRRNLLVIAGGLVVSGLCSPVTIIPVLAATGVVVGTSRSRSVAARTDWIRAAALTCAVGIALVAVAITVGRTGRAPFSLDPAAMGYRVWRPVILPLLLDPVLGVVVVCAAAAVVVRSEAQWALMLGLAGPLAALALLPGAGGHESWAAVTPLALVGAAWFVRAALDPARKRDRTEPRFPRVLPGSPGQRLTVIAVVGLGFLTETVTWLQRPQTWWPDSVYYVYWALRVRGDSAAEAKANVHEFVSHIVPKLPEAYSQSAVDLTRTRVALPVLSQPFVALFGPSGVLAVSWIAFAIMLVFLSRAVILRFGAFGGLVAMTLLLATPRMIYAAAPLTDGLSIMCVALWAILLPWSGRTTRWRVAGLFATSLLLALTRQAPLVIAVPVGLAWLWALRRGRAGLRAWTAALVATGIACAVGVVILLAIAGPTLTRQLSIMQNLKSWSVLRIIAIEVNNLIHDPALLALILVALGTLYVARRSVLPWFTIGALLGFALTFYTNPVQSNLRYMVPTFPLLVIAAAATMAAVAGRAMPDWFGAPDPTTNAGGEAAPPTVLDPAPLGDPRSSTTSR